MSFMSIAIYVCNTNKNRGCEHLCLGVKQLCKLRFILIISADIILYTRYKYLFYKVSVHTHTSYVVSVNGKT